MVHDNIKEDIRSRAEIEEIIGRYVPSLKPAGAQFKGLCPFHKENTPSFVVYPDTQHFYCYGCQKGGDVFTFVMAHEGVEFPEALRLVGQFVGVDIPESGAFGGEDSGTHPPTGTQKADLFSLHEKLTTWYQQQLRSANGAAALGYCRGRGLSDALIEEFRLGYAPDQFDAVKEWGKTAGFSFEQMLDGGVLTNRNEGDPPARAYDRWRGRLMFPIRNPQGRVVGFSGRVMQAEQQGGKYVNSPETLIFHKSSVLYGLSEARDAIREHDVCLLCEGQMDVIACHAAGIRFAVAPQGTAFTEKQAKLIKRYTDNVVLAFDADDAGIAAALKSIDPVIAAGLTARVVRMAAGEDPDSVLQSQGADALRQRIEQAIDYFAFLLQLMRQRHDDQAPAGKTRIVQEFLDAVAKLQSPIIRGEYCQMLAQTLGLALDPVFQELNQILNRQRRQQQFGASAGRMASNKPPPAFAENRFGADSIEDPVIAAEGSLIDLCLHHEAYANRLQQELPVEIISKTPTGQALNDLLAYTAQGEWGVARELLLEDMTKYNSPRLNKALNNPEFGLKTEPETAATCFRDCFGRLMLNHLNRQCAVIEAELRALEDPQERRRKYTELLKLDLARKNYLNRSS